MASSYGIELYEALMNADQNDEEAFTYLLNASIEYCGLTDKELGEQLGISRPSVQYWKDGFNKPARSMRQPVYDYLAEKVNEVIQAANCFRER